MPNLYKQYFVHNEPNKTRVINSDDIVEKRLEKMAELKRMEQKTTDGNGFSAGIVGPDTVSINGGTPSYLLSATIL